MSIPDDCEEKIQYDLRRLHDLQRVSTEHRLPDHILEHAKNRVMAVQKEVKERDDIIWKTEKMTTFFRNNVSLTLAVLFDLALWCFGFQDVKIKCHDVLV